MELAGAAMFRHLPSAEEAERKGHNHQAAQNAPLQQQTVKDKRIEHSGKTSKMTTTITESSFKNKPLKRTPSKKSLKGDQKGSRSCTIL